MSLPGFIGTASVVRAPISHHVDQCSLGGIAANSLASNTIFCKDKVYSLLLTRQHVLAPSGGSFTKPHLNGAANPALPAAPNRARQTIPNLAEQVWLHMRYHGPMRAIWHS